MEAAATLETVDAVRARTGASYAECWRALRAADGDALGAIVQLEAEDAQGWPARRHAIGARLLRAAGEAGRVRVAVRRGPHTVLEVPALAGAALAVLFPRAAALGVLAALAARCSLSMERAPAPR